MTDTKELLQRIAALRTRLSANVEPVTPPDALRDVEVKVHDKQSMGWRYVSADDMSPSPPPSPVPN